MNLSNFTIKAAEVIQQSQQSAFNHSNANIETEHILKALLDQEDSPVEYLLKKKRSKYAATGKQAGSADKPFAQGIRRAGSKYFKGCQ